MSVSGGRSLLLTSAVLLTGCSAHDRGLGGRPLEPSARDNVSILSASPPVETVLHPGDKVPLRVEVEYTLSTAESGTITLVVQRAEEEYRPLANESRGVRRGSGRAVLTTQIEVPETTAIRVLTPLTPQGMTSTRIVSSRTYAVTKR